MRLLAALAILVLLAPPTEGIAFLKISGVTGGTLDARHAGEIDILTWSSSATAVQAVGSTGVGKVVLKDLKVRKRVDQASPQLFALLVTGKHSAEAVITERRPGANIVEPIKVRLTDVVVTGIADMPSTAPAGYPPDEEITLSFATFEISFTPQKADGSLGTPICSCWNKLVATSCACRVAG